MQTSGHPALANLDEYILDTAVLAKDCMIEMISAMAPPGYTLDIITDYTANADVSATGGTLKFEFTLYVTPTEDS